MTKKGIRPHNIYTKEAVKEIIISVNKMFPEEKKFKKIKKKEILNFSWS